MDRPAKLLIGALLGLLGVSAFAGYAQLADPPGFSGGPGDWKFAPSANDQSFGRVVHQPNGLKVPVPGKVVTMPASYRFAANAPRMAARIIFMHPSVRTAAAILGWLASAKLIWDEATKTWRQLEEGSEGGLLWSLAGSENWFATKQEVCNDAMAYWAGVEPYNTYTSATVGDNACILRYKQNGTGPELTYNTGSFASKPNTNNCPAGWTETPAGCLSPAVDQPKFEDLLSPKPMPERVPFELPYPSPLPVDPPWINPAPGPNPEHRPRFVPTGDPVKNPDYNPSADPSPENQPWLQPGVRIVPSPTVDQPWRVDIQPTNRPVPGPEPQPEQDEGPGQGNPSDKPIENADLCEKHPDIVACAKMDEVEPDDVNNEDKNLVITPESGWGNENATCPAPVTKQVAGLNLEMSWQPFCDFASGIRPVVIAMAWLSAALFVLGVARKGD